MSSTPNGPFSDKNRDSVAATLREAAGTWLTGPYRGGGDGGYQGEDLGLPESGPGAVAGGWKRVLGLFVDWILAYGISLGIVPFGSQWLGLVVLGVWFGVGVIAVSLFGFTPGQFVVGTRVARVDFGAKRNAAEAAGTEPRATVGLIRALGRQILIPFLVPALINDHNGRAMHDRATGTAILLTRR